jgi:hypothetical protein
LLFDFLRNDAKRITGTIANIIKNFNMETDLTYYRYDIEHWLDENEQEFGWAKTPEDYAENAVKYHNSNRCMSRCECINEDLEYVTPKLSPEDQIWFMEIAKERIAMKWGVTIDE